MTIPAAPNMTISAVHLWRLARDDRRQSHLTSKTSRAKSEAETKSSKIGSADYPKNDDFSGLDLDRRSPADAALTRQSLPSSGPQIW
jgi:hypothetical protein